MDVDRNYAASNTRVYVAYDYEERIDKSNLNTYYTPTIMKRSCYSYDTIRYDTIVHHRRSFQSFPILHQCYTIDLTLTLS